LTGGSFGQYSGNLNILKKGDRYVWQVSTGRYASEGYRMNSRMRRDFLQSDLRWNPGARHSLTAFLLLADLDYRTPGGLTRSQAVADPRQARPATTTLPSATEQKTGIRNRTAFLGLSDRYALSEDWQAVLSVTGSLTDFRNPFITNYERRDESNLGIRFKAVRTGVMFGKPLSWVTGLEWQSGLYIIDSTGNRRGEPDGNLARDRVRARQSFLFSQWEWKPDERFLIHFGVSINRFGYRLERIVGSPGKGPIEMDFRPQAAPRLAIGYTPSKDLALHFSVSRGFSPPTVAEARPSAGGFATGLQAEKGWSVETGLKSSLFRGRLQLDVTAFVFNLRDAIVRRTDNAGAEYFLNAGGTVQKGIETAAQYQVINRPDARLLRRVRLSGSATLSDFRFEGYAWNGISYDGKRVTGVSPLNLAFGGDWEFVEGLYLRHTYLFTDEMPLNDANDETAPASGVWHLRAGRRWMRGRVGLEAFVAADNPFGETYSSGHDINAFGRRYYNPSPLRSWQAGVVFSF
jgi:iron complex outermembrane receptor protein